MHSYRAFCALLILAPFSVAAEITPLKGDPIKADVVKITDKDVVYKTTAGEVTRPLKDVLMIDYQEVKRPATGVSYSMVELTDGSQLFASKVAVKIRDVEMTLLSGQSIKLPRTVIAGLLNDAQVDANRYDWKSRTLKSRGKEAIVVKGKTTVSTLECALGETDEEGTSITIAVALDNETITSKRKIADLRGLIFKNVLEAKAPPATCKVLDTMQGAVMAASVTTGDSGVTINTPAGAKIELKQTQVARLDFTKGRLEYLSEMLPIKVVEKSNLSEEGEREKWYVFRDTNVAKKELNVGGTRYARGLGLLPQVELTYDLRGDYREFEAVVGFDREVIASGAVILTIQGDGKELSKLTISPKDKKTAQTVILNIKDVQKLRIVLEADGDWDVGRHINLADAKVRKE